MLNFNDYSVPAHVQGPLARYVEHGIVPGSFLTAVLSNDLLGAVGAADEINVRAISDIVKFCFNELPKGCWGSAENVRAWIENSKDRG